MTLAYKKSPRIKFQYSVSYSPAEYESTNHFFPSRPDFQKNYDECLKINKIACLWVVFMLKLTKKFNVLRTWSVFSGNMVHPYVQFQTLDPFHPNKKTFKMNLISCKGVYTQVAHIMNIIRNS